MGQHEPLTLSLDDALDISFADELLSQFDLKRDLLHSPNISISNNAIKDGNHKSILTVSDSPPSINYNKLNHVSPSILPPASQYQVNNNDRQDSVPKFNEDSVMTPAAAISDPTTLLSPELTHNVTLNTTLSLPLTPFGTSQGHGDALQQQNDVSMDSIKVKAKSTPASLPGTIADRAHRRRQNNHNLLRRSSTYLRQKFFAGANAADATESPPPPLPTLEQISSTPPSDNVTDRLAMTMAPNDITNGNTHGQRTKAASLLSPPPTPPSSSIPIIPSSPPPPPPPSNPDMTATTATIVTPVPSPCQYPPKPLHYCPVDPPDDRHRASFPIFSWRKKSLKEPRRQSEPTITSDHIKTRRSFFFL